MTPSKSSDVDQELEAFMERVASRLDGARRRLASVARTTPVLATSSLDPRFRKPVLVKAENLQCTGSFKLRGAFNRVAKIAEFSRSRRVVAASAGNHGQAVAWSARRLCLESDIFMPVDAPHVKIAASEAYGARVHLVSGGFDEAHREAVAHAYATNAVLVHGFADEDVIAGQGTVGCD